MFLKYSIYKQYLSKKTVPFIIQRAKRLQIKGYSKLKKKEMIQLILKHFATKHIQRFTRKKLSVQSTCMISLEKITYPCWAKKTKAGHFIYYNLEPLVKYILRNGLRSRDPCTREEYTNNELKDIDIIYKKSSLSKKLNIKSISKAVKRYYYYKQLRLKEEQIDILIDLLRSGMFDIKLKIEFYNESGISSLYNDNEANQPVEIKEAFACLKNNFKQLTFYMHDLFEKDIEWSNHSFNMLYDIIKKIKPDNPFAMFIKKQLDFEKNKLNYVNTIIQASSSS